MNAKHDTSRRAFFLKGGAALGAGVAAGGTALAAGAPMADADDAAEREAIRRLHLAFTGLMEAADHEAAAALFTADARLQLGETVATGAAAIRHLLVEQYRSQQAASLHDAYRPNGRQQLDRLAIDAGARRATATWHVDVRISTPLQGDSTAAQMARLQGMMGEVRWESGLLQATYVKRAGRWMMASLDYRAA